MKKRPARDHGTDNASGATYSRSDLFTMRRRIVLGGGAAIATCALPARRVLAADDANLPYIPGLQTLARGYDPTQDKPGGRNAYKQPIFDFPDVKYTGTWRSRTQGGVYADDPSQRYLIPPTINFTSEVSVGGQEIKHFKSRSEVEDFYSSEVGVSPKYGQFSGKFERHFSQKVTTITDRLYSTGSFNAEYWTLTLDPVAQPIPAVIAQMMQLPSDYRQPQDFEDYKRFFEEYGIYYVTRVQMGGQATLTATATLKDTTDEQKAKTTFEASYEGFVTSSKAEFVRNNTTRAITGTSEMRQTIIGGDPSKWAVATVAVQGTQTAEGKTVEVKAGEGFNLASWLPSTRIKPTAVKTGLRPLASLIQQKDANRARVFQAASDSYMRQSVRPRIRVYASARAPARIMLDDRQLAENLRYEDGMVPLRAGDPGFDAGVKHVNSRIGLQLITLDPATLRVRQRFAANVLQDDEISKMRELIKATGPRDILILAAGGFRDLQQRTSYELDYYPYTFLGVLELANELRAFGLTQTLQSELEGQRNYAMGVARTPGEPKRVVLPGRYVHPTTFALIGVRGAQQSFAAYAKPVGKDTATFAIGMDLGESSERTGYTIRRVPMGDEASLGAWGR